MLGALLAATLATSQWTIDEANAWGAKQPWMAGCNYIPSTAVNQLEMWQGETFDPVTIEREFALMRRTGMSLARIYLHDVAYESDPAGFKGRLRKVLALASSQKIRIVFVLFDDCWNPDAKPGPQPAPIPGVHNSGWLQSPPQSRRSLAVETPRLKRYVKDVLRSFGKDRNVWMWDLYNEPGNSGYGSASIPLLRAVFVWAREVRPSQPLTAAAYGSGSHSTDPVCLELSDVVTFHNYNGAESLKKDIALYKSFRRPVVCTEWMARTNGSRIAALLPQFKSQGVSALQWGFVSGKTNTIFPWGSPANPQAAEPTVWFHDLYRRDGTPFDPEEVSLYRKLTGARPERISKLGSLPISPNRQGIAGLRKLAEFPLRDPSICRGADGRWYMTGTREPFYGDNQGIEMWSTEDFQKWVPLGVVWRYGKSPWHAPYLAKKMPLWAPEVHYFKGTYWLTYSMPSYVGFNEYSASGLLRSTSGKPEGPYEDVHPSGRLGNEIDGSLFQDDDGTVYFLWHSGMVAKMKSDMSGFAESPRRLKPSLPDPDPKHHSGLCERIFGAGSYDHIGYEGAFMIKRQGTYYLIGSEQIDGRYSCMVATSKNFNGPYSARYEAVPHGGHPAFFRDELGEWWMTFFGSDPGAPWEERPGAVPIRFTIDGRLTMDYR